jgi:hypothetical protein
VQTLGQIGVSPSHSFEEGTVAENSGATTLAGTLVRNWDAWARSEGKSLVECTTVPAKDTSQTSWWSCSTCCSMSSVDASIVLC